jgi:hypothetical protein
MFLRAAQAPPRGCPSVSRPFQTRSVGRVTYAADTVAGSPIQHAAARRPFHAEQPVLGSLAGVAVTL